MCVFVAVGLDLDGGGVVCVDEEGREETEEEEVEGSEDETQRSEEFVVSGEGEEVVVGGAEEGSYEVAQERRKWQRHRHRALQIVVDFSHFVTTLARTPFSSFSFSFFIMEAIFFLLYNGNNK